MSLLYIWSSSDGIVKDQRNANLYCDGSWSPFGEDETKVSRCGDQRVLVRALRLVLQLPVLTVNYSHKEIGKYIREKEISYLHINRDIERKGERERKRVREIKNRETVRVNTWPPASLYDRGRTPWRTDGETERLNVIFFIFWKCIWEIRTGNPSLAVKILNSTPKGKVKRLG